MGSGRIDTTQYESCSYLSLMSTSMHSNERSSVGKKGKEGERGRSATELE